MVFTIRYITGITYEKKNENRRNHWTEQPG